MIGRVSSTRLATVTVIKWQHVANSKYWLQFHCIIFNIKTHFRVAHHLFQKKKRKLVGCLWRVYSCEFRPILDFSQFNCRSLQIYDGRKRQFLRCSLQKLKKTSPIRNTMFYEIVGRNYDNITITMDIFLLQIRSWNISEI